jgi:hypothetical protein
MGVTLRYVVADESGRLARIPAARWERAFHEKESLPEYARQELKVIEVAVEVHGRIVKQVIRVLPFRIRVRPNGRFGCQRIRKACRPPAWPTR